MNLQRQTSRDRLYESTHSIRVHFIQIQKSYIEATLNEIHLNYLLVKGFHKALCASFLPHNKLTFFLISTNSITIK